MIAFLLFTSIELANSFTTAEKRLPSSDQSIELYANQTGDNLTELYLSAINSAQESISLVIYSLNDLKIIDALKQQSEWGISVYIVCDAKASKKVAQQIPEATVVKRVGEGLTHQKILVIDNNQILLGSANMTSDSLNVHGNLVLGLHHPALAKVLSLKAQSMDDEGNSAKVLHSLTSCCNQNLELWLLPDDTEAIKRLTELLRSARKTIKVAMFTWTRWDLTQELIDASHRGVRVETVIDRSSGKGASSKIVKMLDQAGISVRLSTGQGLLHHKFAYIDGDILINGSANWTQAAFKSNDDCFTVVYPMTKEQKTKMNKLWKTISKQSLKP